MNKSLAQPILERLHQVEDYLRRFRVLEGGVLLVSVFSCLIALGLLLNLLAYLDTPVRTVITLTGLAALASLAGWRMLTPLLTPRRPRAVALLLESRYPGLQNRLVTTLDLARCAENNPEGYSLDLIQAVARQSAELLPGLDYRPLVDRSKLKRYFWPNLVAALIVLALWVSFPDRMANAWERFSRPFGFVPNLSATRVVVTPGNTAIPRGEDLTIRARIEGEPATRVDLYRRTGSSGDFTMYRMTPLENDTSGRTFTYTISAVKRDLEYRVQAGDGSSEVFQVKVIDYPQVLSLQIKLTPPLYSALPTQNLEANDGNIVALAGTKASLHIRCSRKLNGAWMVFADSTRLAFNLAGDEAELAFMVKRDAGYFISILDETGAVNREPIAYNIRAIPDQSPAVAIERPGQDMDLTEELLVPMTISGDDDFGFSSFRLRYFINTDTMAKEIKLPFSQFGKSRVRFDYSWDLSQITLVPQDIVTYWVEGFDNDNVTGPKKAESRRFTLRYPSIDEIINEVHGDQEKVTDDVANALKQEKDLSKNLQDLKREMLQNQEMSWEQKKDLEGKMAKQQEILDKIQKSSEELKETLEKIDENRLQTQEMIEKMMEVQQLLEQVATPEMKQAMQKLQEAMEKMDPNLLKEAMKNFTMNQEEMTQRLDRMLDLLKKMKLEQRLNELAEMAKKLAEQQQRVNEQLETASDQEMKESLARQQEQISKDLENLKKQMKEAKEMASEFPQLPQEKLEKAQEQMEEQQIPNQSQQMKSNLQAGNKGQCKSKGKKLKEDLDQLASLLEDAKKQMMQAEMEEVKEALRLVAYQLLQISYQQEALNDSTRGATAQDLRVADLARRQGELFDQTEKVTNFLFDLAKKTLAVPADAAKLMALAMRSMNEAIKALTGMNVFAAPEQQKMALGGLNGAIVELMKAQEQMKKSGGGQGGEMMTFQQQMNQMAQQQMGLCQQAGQMMSPGGQPSQMSMQQLGAMGRMAAEQEALRQKVQDLQREVGQRGEMLGRLDEIGNDMQRVADELRGGNLDDETVKRQYNIHSRMLDITKSMQKREYKKERISKTAGDFMRPSPGALPDNAGAQPGSLQEDILRAMEAGYPRAYESLIRSYFNALTNENRPAPTPEKSSDTTPEGGE